MIWETGLSSHPGYFRLKNNAAPSSSQELQKEWVDRVDRLSRNNNLLGYNIWAYSNENPIVINNQPAQNNQRKILAETGLKTVNGTPKKAWDFFSSLIPS